MMSGRWLRIAPDDSSMPLQTMSYWNALMVSGSWLSSASSPPCGIEKGLWEKSIFFSSSFHSYIGKSTIQQNSKTSFLLTPRSLPMRMRAAPASLAALSALSQAKKTASPGESFAFSTSANCASELQEFGDRPPARQRPAFAFEDDVAEARRALSLRPVVELVEERARLLRRARRRDRPHHAARLDHLLEGVERHVVARKHLRHVGDL